MPALADMLPARPSRELLLRLIAEAAINDAAFRQALLDDPSRALRRFFGRRPPTAKYDFRVVAEDASTYGFVIPDPRATRTGPAPPTITPRPRFEGRLNSILRQRPGSLKQFEQDPRSFIANELNFRLPEGLDVLPLREGKDPQTGKRVVYLVLTYPPHDGLFRQPYSLRFDRPTSLLSVAATPSLDMPAGLTVETWLRPTSLEPGEQDGVAISRYGARDGWELGTGGARPRFAVTIGGTTYSARPSSKRPLLLPGRWYYVGGVYTGSALQIWLDGVCVAELPLSGPLEADSPLLTVGDSSDPQRRGRGFRGDVDELRLWRRALSADELHRRHPRRRDALPEDGGHEDLRLFFPCGEGNGTIVRDDSGHGNDGVLTDVRWISETVDVPERGG